MERTLKRLQEIITVAVILSSHVENVQADGFKCSITESVYIPDQSDCTKFYQCTEAGWVIENKCPHNLHFNPEKNVCDYPESAGCDTPFENTTVPVESVTTTAGNDAVVQDDPDCPPNSEDKIILFPHETDCSKFYQCSYGQKWEKDCPDGLYYNPSLEFCDYKENVECENDGCHTNGTVANGTGSGVSDTGETNPVSNGTAPDVNGTLQSDPDCPPDSEDKIILFPHETDCSKFYQCSYGEKWEKNCPDGLYYNPSKEYCDYKENVDCRNKGPSKRHVAIRF